MGTDTTTLSSKPMAPGTIDQGTGLPAATSRREKSRTWMWLVLAGSALLASIVFYVQSRPAPEFSMLRVSGNIEMTDAEVSFKIAGRVAERLLSEGETVKPT